MSQATPFVPGADYSADITPGDLGNALDADFDDLKLTTDDLRANLALIQRDDGLPANATVHPDALTTATLALIASDWTPRGAWLTATLYAIGDVVENSGTSYVCAVEHVSGTFATDDAAGKWVQLSDRQTLLYAAAGGTADVITAALPITVLEDGRSYFVSASAANATTTPTLNPASIGAKTIVKNGNQALVAGDIVGSGHVLHLVYRSGINKFELLNPGVTISAYARTLLDDASAAAARSTLDVPSNAEAILDTIIAAKGDLIVGTANDTPAVKTVGSNGSVLTADSSQSDGLIWVPQYPRSLAPNPFFQVDQLANSATSVADDNYGHDHWYVLTQTASVQVSSQTLQENGQSTNARLTQNQAAAQRMGYACIIEAAEAQKYRGMTMTFKPRLRISNSQAVRCAVVEWTGTADSVTSDIVNDWTSSDYTDGAAKFFVDTSLTPLGTSTVTPSAATWTDATALNVTIGNSCNNLILFVWTEGTAAQNVTLDIGKVRFVPGTYAGDIELPTFADTLRYAQRFFEKSFDYALAPASGIGVTSGEFYWSALVAGAVTQRSPQVCFQSRKRIDLPTITFYNPAAAGDQVRNVTDGADCTSTTTYTAGNTAGGFYVSCTGTAGTAINEILAVQWTADARL